MTFFSVFIYLIKFNEKAQMFSLLSPTKYHKIEIYWHVQGVPKKVTIWNAPNFLILKRFITFMAHFRALKKQFFSV